MTVAIAKDFSVELAAGILVAYQISRAISQFIQVSQCTAFTGYVLNVLALLTYVALVIYIEVLPDGKYWYIPFAFLGPAETLAIQQFYLIKLYGADVHEDNMDLRHAVKASHTGTGIGSMAAFLTSSRVYAAYGIPGVSYLGLGIQAAKIVTNLMIDRMIFIQGQNFVKNTTVKNIKEVAVPNDFVFRF